MLNVKSKKGILGENFDIFKDLDCSSVTLNLEFNNMIYPNEVLDAQGNIVARPRPTENYIEQKFNGKSFYFNATEVQNFERNVKQYYDMGADVSVILYPMNQSDPSKFPQLMTYYPWATQNTTIMGINTSTSYGFEYYLALMEMLASRLTRHNFDKGFVTTFVIGNEIDYAREYNRISEKQADFDVYMEEYSRLLRLSNLAVKKYHADIKVAFSVTNAFSNPGYTLPGDQVQAYITKNIVTWMNEKSKMEGDYDWGIAPHNYCASHSRPNCFEFDSQKGKSWGLTADFNTDSVTMTNIEVWDKFVNQDFMKFNGKARNLYITETGVCAKNKEEEAYQVVSIVATYYKMSQIDSIKWFNYYRMSDHPEETSVGWNHGLLYADGTKKAAYEVYKYLDTQYSLYKANEYLKYASYYDLQGNLHSYENGGLTSYLDLLDVFESGWMDGKEFDWSKATSNQIEPHYDWEDVVDLSQVVFNSKSYLYNGAARTIQATNLPEGVTVKYSINGGEEVANVSCTQIGTYEMIASFYKDGARVGRRKAVLSIGRMETNKSIYQFGERVFVNVTRNAYGDDAFKNSLSNPWIGIYKKGDIPGQSRCLHYIYLPAGDDNLRTFNICEDGFGQDPLGNATEDPVILSAGEYFVYYSATSGYDEVQRTEFVVLDPYVSSDTVDLSGVWIEDMEVDEDGAEHEIVLQGTLPENVKAVFVNDCNKQKAGGNHQVTLELRDKNTDELLESRYAVLKINPYDKVLLATNKTEYMFGEEILVTAYPPLKPYKKDGCWVGIHRIENGQPNERYYRWYYVNNKDNNTYKITSEGETYDIANMDYGWKEDNSLNTDLLTPGEYAIILHDGDSAEVARIDIVINEAPITLEINKTHFEVGEDVIITANVPEYLLDQVWWVGVYHRDFTNFGQAGNGTIYYYYVSYTDPGVTLYNGVAVNIKRDLEGDRDNWHDFVDLPAGRYSAFLFRTNGYEVIKTVEFTIGNEIDIVEGKTQFTRGEKFHIRCSYPNIQPSYQWITMYAGDNIVLNPNDGNDPQNAAYLKTHWTYLYDIVDTWEVDTADLEAGKYTIVTFQNAAYTEATRIVIEVVD